MTSQFREVVRPIAMSLSNKLLKTTIPVARTLRWCDVETRRQINEGGVHILPANFYSTVPTVEEIEKSFEYAESTPPYLTDQLFDAEGMRDYLDELMPFAEEFDPPTEGDQDDPAGYFWGSKAFGFSDAMSYYSMIRKCQPKRIVEVGSGHSTLVALEALKRNGGGELVCVEPYPREFLTKLDGITELVQKPVQELSVEWFNENLADGDLLFIDSTHTVKLGSDCLHLYLRVLPGLRKDLMIHAHDIFLPEAYPQSWALEKNIFWTEQYLLMALLMGDPEYTVRFGSNYHRLVNPDALEKFMGGKAVGGGGSFWFEKRVR